jgi:hypothetical protein
MGIDSNVVVSEGVLEECGVALQVRSKEFIVQLLNSLSFPNVVALAVPFYGSHILAGGCSAFLDAGWRVPALAKRERDSQQSDGDHRENNKF